MPPSNPAAWVADTYTSLCIDAGSPSSPVGNEPAPNGGRINQGAYGGTWQTSETNQSGPFTTGITSTGDPGYASTGSTYTTNTQPSVTVTFSEPVLCASTDIVLKDSNSNTYSISAPTGIGTAYNGSYYYSWKFNLNQALTQGQYSVILQPTIRGATGNYLGSTTPGGPGVAQTRYLNIWTSQPSVTLGVGQYNPTGVSPVVFSATFSRGMRNIVLPNTAFSVTATGTGANPVISSVTTVDNTTFLIGVTGMPAGGTGTVTLTLGAGTAPNNGPMDYAGNLSTAAPATQMINWENTPFTATYGTLATPQSAPLGAETVTFNKTVTGLTYSNFTLVRDGVSIPLTSAQTILNPTGDQENFVVSNLSPLTAYDGNYTLAMTGVTDWAHNPPTTSQGVLNPVVTWQQVTGNIIGAASPNVIRIVANPTNPAIEADVYINNNTSTPTFTENFAPMGSFPAVAQLQITGHPGDQLILDCSQGGIEPGGGMTFTGASGDTVTLKGTTGDDSVFATSNQLSINGSTPLTYSNVQSFNLNFQTGNDSLVVSGASLLLNQAGELTSTTDVTINSGTLNLGGFNDTIDALTLRGGTLSGGTLTVNNSMCVQSGTISANLAGPGALLKTSGSSVVLSGTNTYTGGTYIISGTTPADLNSPVSLDGDGAGQTQSAAADNLSGPVGDIQPDTTTMSASYGYIPSPSSTPVNQVIVSFFINGTTPDPTPGLTIANFKFLRDGVTLSLSGAQTVTGNSNSTVWTISGLSSLAAYDGNYTFSMVGVHDSQGNAPLGNPTANWQQIFGKIGGPGGTGDVIRIVADPIYPTTEADVYINNNTSNPTYTENFATVNGFPPISQLSVVDSGTGFQLILDCSQGGILPGGALTGGAFTFNGGALSNGDSIVVKGSTGDDSVFVTPTQICVAGSTPLTYSNIASFGFNLQGGNDTLIDSGGALVLNQANALTSGTDVTINSGSIDLGGTSDTIDALTLRGGTLSDGTLTVNNSLALQNGTIGASLAGAGASIKTGSSSVVVSGTNTITGSTCVSAGTIQSSNALAFQGSDVNLAAGTTLNLSGVSGTAVAVGALDGTGSVTLPSTANQLTFNGGNSSAGFTGAISGGASSLALVKTGAGTMTLAGTRVGSSYGTSVRVYGGVLRLSDATNFNLPISDIAPGTVEFAVSGSAGTPTLNNYISGTGAVAKTGAGTMVLSGAGITYSGSTTVTGGLLRLSDATNFNSPVTDSAALELAVSSTAATMTLAQTISGAGSLTKSGNGTLVMNLSNPNFTGPTQVTGGQIAVNNAGALGSAANSTNTLTINLGTASFPTSVVLASNLGQAVVLSGLSILQPGVGNSSIAAPASVAASPSAAAAVASPAVTVVPAPVVQTAKATVVSAPVVQTAKAAAVVSGPVLQPVKAAPVLPATVVHPVKAAPAAPVAAAHDAVHAAGPVKPASHPSPLPAAAPPAPVKSGPILTRATLLKTVDSLFAKYSK